MRTLITGVTGQLGQAIKQVLEEQDFDILDFPRYNVQDHAIVPKISELYPELVVHCAAMTNVDGCAKDPDAAFSINAFGTQNVAHACLRCNAEMVYISTNEVFNGRSDRPYREDDKPNPINPYGSSKRSGEQMAAHYLKNGLYIVRTAWLYGGGHMFPEKILAAADKFGELRVVTDEVGNPTYTLDLALAVAALVRTRTYGIYHFTNAGYCSRYEYAQEVLRLGGRDDVPIRPITLAEYSRPSAVPPFAPLANSAGAALGIELRPWQEALAAYFESKRGDV
ncbi:MAG: dTDP-4-dehydrorhamnose reductase [Anaerolineaceae bacterium]|nr:dTDP-4-dehydrorhamnose reductase [Anaerolineaceae bacterium]MCB9101943.1 dTDP-4-dehydrorhamnose reductase [Anaerolineales bacterium]